jgi:hypothetical protein
MATMKLTGSLLTLTALCSFFLLSSCETLTEKNDECEKTQWENYIDAPMVFYIDVPQFYCDYPENIYFTDNSDKMICAGSVTKVYCDGSIGGKFDFNTTFYPAGMDKNDLDKQRVGLLYQFKFQNDKDHVVFSGRLKAFFPGDVIYESDEFTKKIYNENLKLDIDNYRYYYHVLIPDQTPWFRVSGE